MSVVDMMTEETEQAPAGGKRKRMLLVAVLVVALAAGAAWWFMLRPAAAEEPPEPGVVLKLDPIQVNLAGGHYLRIGIALQASKGADTELDGSQALDATIDLFSGQQQEKLGQAVFRNKLKHSLERKLEEEYDGQVIGVYFTDFVTQ